MAAGEVSFERAATRGRRYCLKGSFIGQSSIEPVRSVSSTNSGSSDSVLREHKKLFGFQPSKSSCITKSTRVIRSIQ